MSRSIYNSLYRRYRKTLPEYEVAARAAALIAADTGTPRSRWGRTATRAEDPRVAVVRGAPRE